MALKLWMAFEAVAPDKESLKDSLQEHIDTLESEDDIELLESEVDEVSEVENPHPNMETGYSQIAELRVEVNGFDRAIQTIINYGPTYVQLEGPDDYNISLREGQEALQNVADTMHQYAQMGVGGVLVSRTEDE